MAYDRNGRAMEVGDPVEHRYQSGNWKWLGGVITVLKDENLAAMVRDSNGRSRQIPYADIDVRRAKFKPNAAPSIRDALVTCEQVMSALVMAQPPRMEHWDNMRIARLMARDALGASKATAVAEKLTEKPNER